MENQNEHPVSQDDFNEVVANNGEFSYYGESYTTYREYLADCLETDEVREEYSEEVLKKWRRKVQFEDLFKTYHVYDIIGINTKKSITLNEYRTMFAKFVRMVFDESGGPQTALPADDIPDDIASRDTDGTISAFTTMMTRMENSLYSLGVVGTSARDSLIPLVILRLLQDHFESGIIDIMDIEKYPYNKIRVTEESIKYVLLKNYRDLDAASASMLLGNMWQHVLSQHPVTSKIFEPGKYVDIRSDVVLLSIINELVSFDFENCSPDNLSIAYQHFIHRQFKGESGSRMGQHFTPDRLINMMIREYGHLIPTTGKYADPFMGTAGFIMAMYNANKTARSSDNPSEYLYGTEIDPNVFKYAFTNLLVQTGQVCDNIKNESAFVNHKDRYSAVFTNPPFGKTISKDEKPKTYKYNLAKVANRNLVCLQYCMHILAPGGICSMVWVNGAECFGSNKSAKEVRKRLFTEFHFLGAIMIPGQKKVFEHAGIKPIVLTFRKPTDDDDVVTPSLKIYECDEACETIELVMEADAEKLEEKDYVISVDAYKEREQLVVHEDAEIKTLGEVCEFLPTNKIKTSEGKKSGEYKFYNSSQDAILYTDTPTIDKESVIIGNGGNANVHYDTKFTPSKHVTVCHVKDDAVVSTKFIYYYLRYNIHVLDEISKGAALKWINKTNLSELQIPIPSLERQKEIIERIMEWEESLKVNEEAIKRAESDISRIASRSLSLGSNMETKTLGEVCEFKNGNRITKKDIQGGPYPVYGGGDSHYNHEEFNRSGETLIISRFGVSPNCVRIVSGNIFLNDSAISLHSKECIDQDYLKYCVKYLLEKSIYDTCRGSAQKNINITDVMNLQIPVPSIERQKEIIEMYKNMESRIKTNVDHKNYLERHKAFILENMSREFQ